MQDIKFKSLFTLTDYRKVAYYNTYGRHLILPIGNGILLLFGIFNLVGMISAGAGIYSVIISIICIAYPIFSFAAATRRINRNIKKNNVPNEVQQRISVGENGIIFSRQDRTQHYQWENVEHVYETKNYLLVYTDDSRVMTLPKRDVSEEELYHAKAIFTSKLSFKKYRLRR